MSIPDYIICDHPLPGDPPAFVRGPGSRFLTHSLDDTDATYRITADGRLAAVSTEEQSWGGLAGGLGTFTGEVEFYAGNCSASAEGFAFTHDGRDAESVSYRARFLGGRLLEIVESTRTREPALPRSSLDGYDAPPPTDEEIAGWEARQAESLVGRSMYRTWGTFDGSFEGEPVAIVAESEREWVARKPDGTFEPIDRRSRDVLLFDSEADAIGARRERDEAGERRRAAWAAELAERAAAKGERS